MLEELRHHQATVGLPPGDAPETDRRKVIAKTITYLENNQTRMNYPECRRQGLPITTACMESLVKEINYRAKGTEMLWNDPGGAEVILQVRAAALGDDDRLTRHLRSRLGCSFTRRPQSSSLFICSRNQKLTCTPSRVRRIETLAGFERSSPSHDQALTRVNL